MTLKDIIPPKLRKPAYAIYALLGLLIGSIQVGYLAAEAAIPTWLIVAWTVYGFVGGPIGAVASSNTNEFPYPPEHTPRHGK